MPPRIEGPHRSVCFHSTVAGHLPPRALRVWTFLGCHFYPSLLMQLADLISFASPGKSSNLSPPLFKVPPRTVCRAHVKISRRSRRRRQMTHPVRLSTTFPLNRRFLQDSVETWPGWVEWRFPFWAATHSEPRTQQVHRSNSLFFLSRKKKWK